MGWSRRLAHGQVVAWGQIAPGVPLVGQHAEEVRLSERLGGRPPRQLAVGVPRCKWQVGHVAPKGMLRIVHCTQKRGREPRWDEQPGQGRCQHQVSGAQKYRTILNDLPAGMEDRGLMLSWRLYDTVTCKGDGRKVPARGACGVLQCQTNTGPDSSSPEHCAQRISSHRNTILPILRHPARGGDLSRANMATNTAGCRCMACWPDTCGMAGARDEDEGGKDLHELLRSVDVGLHAVHGTLLRLSQLLAPTLQLLVLLQLLL